MLKSIIFLFVNIFIIDQTMLKSYVTLYINDIIAPTSTTKVLPNITSSIRAFTINDIKVKRKILKKLRKMYEIEDFESKEDFNGR